MGEWWLWKLLSNPGKAIADAVSGRDTDRDVRKRERPNDDDDDDDAAKEKP
jgi:hypothetical protein